MVYIVHTLTLRKQGIVPTLIIVRIGLGISTQDTSTTFATTKGDNTTRDPGPGSNNRRLGPNHAVDLPIIIRRGIETETTVDQYSEGPKKGDGYADYDHSSSQVGV